MNEVMEIIKIQQVNLNGEAINSVNARELHERLEVGRDFSNWIKQRLDETQAVENQDFTVFAKFGENQFGGRPTNEYLISLDTAKHIAMLEKSEIGRKIRQYFIDVEKKIKAMTVEQMIADPAHAIALLQALQKEQEARKVAEAAREKAEKERLWIRSKAEATAMATASVKSRALEKLKLEMGEHKEYASVLRVAIATVTSEKDYNWRPLKQYSEEHGLEIHSIPDPRFGKVKTYHKDAWYNVYDIDLEELFA